MVFSVEAIEVLLDRTNHVDKANFIKFCYEVIEHSKSFFYFIQAIICGTDNSIAQIDFGEEYNIINMQMPEDNKFLSYHWQVLDVFHFGYRFENAKIDGNKIITLMSKHASGSIEEIMDENKGVDLCCTDKPFIADKVNKILYIFKLLRLITRQPIWCSELIRSVESGAVSHSNPLSCGNVYRYNKQPYSITKSEAKNIDDTIKKFPFPASDEILNLALLNYDYSFYVPDNVAIIMLITCLEIIFHPGDKDELKYRIARNVAVFLGKIEDESNLLFEEVKRLYDLRSSLVHAGKINFSKHAIIRTKIVLLLN